MKELKYFNTFIRLIFHWCNPPHLYREENLKIFIYIYIYIYNICIKPFKNQVGVKNTTLF